MKIIQSEKIIKQATAASRIAEEVANLIKKRVRELNPADRERDWEITSWIVANLQEMLQNKRPY